MERRAGVAGDFIGTRQAAELLGVSVSTVQKMVEAGLLPAWRTQGGHRRIPLEALRRHREQVAGVQAARAGRPLTVLVVEDNPVMRKSYERMFRDWGGSAQVRYAGDGAEALLALAQERPDVLFTDLAMQPFDGYHLIGTVQANAQLADLRIVVVTGLSPARDRPELADPRTVVWRKPLHAQRLAGYLDAQLQVLAFR